MGLFSKKKEEQKDIRKEPGFPQYHEEFPKYESVISSDDISAIKYAIKQEERPPMPLRKPTFAAMHIKEEPSIKLPDEIRMPYMEEPLIQPSMSTDVYKQEKTLFIKIDKYKEAIEKIEKIKYQLEDISKVISKINELKSEEDSEINKCNGEIDNIRESINNIDKMLFGR
ncbi:hypothetical protein J4409_02170 [Candidatus Woesearchaeota archaeon]|nr:hypothetical protein [Candidatus Woesearchaeota archaeon]